MIEKHFLYLWLSLGTLHIDESVFAFILDSKSGKFQQVQGEKQCVHHLVWCIVPTRHLAIKGVECCLFVLRFTRTSNQINEKCSTLSLFVLFDGAGETSNSKRMEERMIYEHLMTSVFKCTHFDNWIARADFYDHENAKSINLCILCALLFLKANEDNSCGVIDGLIDQMKDNINSRETTNRVLNSLPIELQ